MRTKLEEMMTRVPLGPGLMEALESAHDVGVRIGACSASSEAYIVPALELRNVLRFIEHPQCGAEKKLPNRALFR